MKGDFSRLTFDKYKHYSGVRVQQGRVQLDADWNEQLDITAHRIETEITDLIGASGAPAEPKDKDGNSTSFRISKKDSSLVVGKGRYYVAGKLFENDENHKPVMPDEAPTDAATYIAYLDVWQQHITALDDPAIREVALGGPDTATRIKNRWEVRFEPAEQFSKPKCQFKVGSTGGMKVERNKDASILENQLYRVEIHKGGVWSEATFKWSQDNGSVAVAVTRQENTLTLDRAADVSRFKRDQWVEVTDVTQREGDVPGILRRVNEVSETTVTLEDGDPWGNKSEDTTVSVMRLWDSMASVKSGHKPPGFAQLEKGIEVQFGKDKNKPRNPETYQPGDYWLFPVRAAGNSIEWPAGDDFQPPHGVEHAYVPLAKVVWDGSAWKVLEDLRSKTIFQPLTVDNNGVSAKLIQEDWRDARDEDFNLEHGWMPYSQPYEYVACFKDGQGIVHMKGVARWVGDYDLNDPGWREEAELDEFSGSFCGRVFVLPPEYRPANVLIIPGIAGGKQQSFFTRLEINSSGEVSVKHPIQYDGDAWVSFDGITFRAAT